MTRYCVFKEEDYPVIFVGQPDDLSGAELADVIAEIPQEIVDQYQAASEAWYDAQVAVAKACGMEWR